MISQDKVTTFKPREYKTMSMSVNQVRFSGEFQSPTMDLDAFPFDFLGIMGAKKLNTTDFVQSDQISLQLVQFSEVLLYSFQLHSIF